MILFVCAIVLLIVGVLYLILPKKYLVNAKSIKSGQTEDEAIKKYRKLAIIFIILGIIFLIV